MKYLVRILAPTLIFLSFLQVLPAFGQEKKEKEPWKGKRADGTVITEEDLVKTLVKHLRWNITVGKKGQQANLSKADLHSLVLGKAILDIDKLSGAETDRLIAQVFGLIEGDLDDADLVVAFLREGKLRRAIMGLAHLVHADFSGAKLNKANLSGANLRSADLGGAELWHADLSGATQYYCPGNYKIARYLFEYRLQMFTEWVAHAIRRSAIFYHDVSQLQCQKSD